MKFTLFATGLHEALGLHVAGRQHGLRRPAAGTDEAHRPRRRRRRPTSSSPSATSGASPATTTSSPSARPATRTGNFFVTLNVGFGGGHQAKAPWRGWCVKVDAEDGEMEPCAYGPALAQRHQLLARTATCSTATTRASGWRRTRCTTSSEGEFYGHQAGLRWVKDSPFAGKVPEKVASGMLYDGADQGTRRRAGGMPGRSTRRASGSPTAGWASPPASRSGTRPAASSARSPASASSATRRTSMRHARGPGEGERRVPGGVLPVPQRLPVRRQPPRASRPDGSLYRRPDEPRLGLARRQAVRPAADRLHRQGAVRDPHDEADDRRAST